MRLGSARLPWFEWQRFYEYDVAIEQMPFVRAGDTFELRCTYDNTMDNRSFARRSRSRTSMHRTTSFSAKRRSTRCAYSR